MCSILKKYWSELKWVANYIKSFLPQIIFLIVNGVLISLVGVSFAFVSRNLIDIATHAAKGSFVNAGILFGCLIIVQMLLNSVYSVTSTRISENMGNKMKQNMFEKLMKTEWLPYNSIHSGDVITRMTSDTSNVTSGVVDLLPSIISLIVQLAVAFIALMYFEPALALTALVIAPVFILLGRVFAGRIRTFHLKTQEAESKTRSFIQEILQNILTVKAFNIERLSTVRLAD